MDTLTLAACAKLNIGLRVAGLRADGYHELDSVFQTIDLTDQLTLTLREAPGTQVRMVPDRGIDPNANLVHRAIALLDESVDRDAGLSVQVDKRIPIGAGLGGGSSDAAATLVALSHLWGLGLSRAELQPYARRLGSDVSFFLHGGRCRVSGRGDRIEPMGDGNHAIIEAYVLVVPPWPLATSEVYRTFDQLRSSSLINSPYANDLEAAALQLEPRLGSYRDWLLAKDVAFGMSGSGPVYFALASSVAEATDMAAAADRELSGDALVCQPTTSGQQWPLRYP